MIIHYSECSSCLRDYYHDVRFGIPPISKLLILRKPKTWYFVEGLTEVSVGIAKWSCEWDCHPIHNSISQYRLILLSILLQNTMFLACAESEALILEGLTEVSVGIAKWSCEWDCHISSTCHWCCYLFPLKIPCFWLAQNQKL
jgi:hypothetical protein